MTVTIIRTKSLLPKNWRKTLAPRVHQLPISELNGAFDAAEKILETHSDAEVQKIADNLWQSIAQSGWAVPDGEQPNADGTALDPRTIYLLYSNSPAAAPQGLSLLESLAIGTVLTLARACDAMEAAKNKTSWLKATRELAAARAFGEWVYMGFMQQGGALFLGAAPSSKEFRQAVKAKIKQKKSAAAKMGSRKAYKPNKQVLYEWYEQHKSEFKSLSKAAEKAVSAKLFVDP